MRRSPLILAAAVLASTFAAPLHAQWAWRDKAGQTHMSDLPPPRDVPERDILRRPEVNRAMQRKAADAAAPAASAAAASSAAASLEGRVDPELEARRRKLEQEQTAQRKQQQAAEQARIAAARAENCRRAQGHLRTLADGGRIARVNAQGEREILDDAARAAETQRAREVVASDCR